MKTDACNHRTSLWLYAEGESGVKVVAVLIIVLLVYGACGAHRYYAAPYGDDSADGSITTPWQTIGYGVAQMIPGDTLELRGGAYTCNVEIAHIAASAAAPFTMCASSGEIASITPGNSDWQPALRIVDATHVYVTGIRFAGRVKSHATHLALRRAAACGIVDCSFVGAPYPPALALNACTNVTIEDCFFQDTGTASRDWDTHLVLDDGCTAITITGCRFPDPAAAGVTDHAIELRRASDAMVMQCTFSGYDNESVVMLGIPTWFYTAGEPLPHDLSLISNWFGHHKSTAVEFHNVYRACVDYNTFVSNTATTISFDGDICHDNACRNNRCVDNFNPAAEYFSVISTYQHGWSNTICANEIFNSYVPAEESRNDMNAIQVMRAHSYYIASNYIHDLVVRARVDYSHVNRAWTMTPEEGGRAGTAIFVAGEDDWGFASNMIIHANTISNTGSSGIYLAYTCGARVTGNRLWRCGTEGIALQRAARANVVDGNEIGDSGWLHGGTSAISVWNAGPSNVVACNWCHHHRQGTIGNKGTNWWADGNGLIADDNSDDTFFIGNLSAYNEGRGLAITASERVRVYNNTFANNGKCPQLYDMEGLGVFPKNASGWPASSNTIVNNIFYNNAAGELSVDDIRGQIIHHNLYFTNVLSATPQPIYWYDPALDYYDCFMTVAEWRDYCAVWHPGNGSGAVWAAPEFSAPYVDATSPASHNHDRFRLTAASPCIDAGTNLPWMTGALDLDGNPRIHDGCVDMGCYEFVPEPAGLLLGIFAMYKLQYTMWRRRKGQ